MELSLSFSAVMELRIIAKLTWLKTETENENRTHESERKRATLHRLIEARTIENDDKVLADVRLIRNINIYTYIPGFESRVSSSDTTAEIWIGIELQRMRLSIL